MSLDDVHLALDWARTEGWNPGLDDAAAFYSADRDGFYMARVADVPAAVISVVNHTPELAFLGLYIAAPTYRGQGVGMSLWTHALEHAGRRTVGLDGVPDQQSNYRKSGFEKAGETHRFSGRLEGRASPDVRSLRDGEMAAAQAVEARASGYAKPEFAAEWFTDRETRRTLVLDREGVAGLVTVRTCAEGHKIGPLVAGTVSDAETLFRAAVAEVDAGDVMIDVPDDCPELMAFCAGEGLTVSFNTARMYRGAAPTPGPGQRAVATLELG